MTSSRQVFSPVAGTVRPLSEASDPVFAGEMVGGGVLVVPDEQPQVTLCPADGTLAKVHPHAFALTTSDGLGLLVHLGIDTVKLKGEPFEVLCPSSGSVTRGQQMIAWNPADVTAQELSAEVLVCAMEAPAGSITSEAVGQHVEAGDLLFTIPDEVQARQRKSRKA